LWVLSAVVTTAAPVVPSTSAPVTAAGTSVSARAPTAGAASAALAGVALLGLFHAPAFEHGLAAQADLAHRVNTGDHDSQFVAETANIFNLFDPFAIQL
jgi:hypothetical protein